MTQTPRAILEDLYRTAVAAVDPAAAVRRALAGRLPDPQPKLFILSLGKAAAGMADGALGVAREKDIVPAGGLIITSEDPPNPLVFDSVTGDHPLPGPRSLAAALRIDRFAREIGPGDEIWVFLSGGTSSLIAAPVQGIPDADLIVLYQLLLGSGLDIHQMNQVRKRFSRWGAGRLAEAMPDGELRVFAISDVPGDDLADIGSGPCVPDPSRAGEIRQLLEQSRLWPKLPIPLRDYLAAVERGERAETPKPGHPSFDRVDATIIASNRTALEAAAERAEAFGLETSLQPPLLGNAETCGYQIAEQLLAVETGERRDCLLWGGETTVPLGNHSGQGGRCQELAIAAAIRFDAVKDSSKGVWLLAAGTDGRDGPTDAAGAIVDQTTVARIRSTGRDPIEQLKQHDAYPALDAAGALLKTGPTGTNVMDIVIGIVGAHSVRPST